MQKSLNKKESILKPRQKTDATKQGDMFDKLFLLLYVFFWPIASEFTNAIYFILCTNYMANNI